MDAIHTNLDQLVHIRIILGVLVGLSITRLANGLAKFVQHPTKFYTLYLTHLIWVAFIFLSVIHFWWFEFSLTNTEIWTFEYYVFLIVYAATFFFISTLLFPDELKEYGSYKEYFHARQAWFYGLLIFCYLIDFVDSYLKGITYFKALGHFYLIRQAIMLVLCSAAVFIKARIFHLCFSIMAILLLVVFVFDRYQYL